MPECFLYESVVFFFAVWDSKMAAVTKNSAEHENDNLNNRLMDFDQICVRMILA